MTEDSVFYNQSDFAKFLTAHGFDFTRHKMGVYIKRGLVPKPDIILSGVKYWKEKTCFEYVDQLKNKA